MLFRDDNHKTKDGGRSTSGRSRRHRTYTYRDAIDVTKPNSSSAHVAVAVERGLPPDFRLPLLVCESAGTCAHGGELFRVGCETNVGCETLTWTVSR